MNRMPFKSIVSCFIILLNSMEIQSGICRWSQGVNIDGVCFLLNTTQLTYDESKAYCASIGGALATVNTMTQLNTIAAMANLYDSIWIGANDIDVEGVWRWEDSGALATELTAYWDVANGQPDNDGNVADCADIYVVSCRSGRLWDDACNLTYSFVCMDKDLYTTSATTTTTTRPTTTVNTNLTTPSVKCRWPGSIYVDGSCFLYNSTIKTYDKAQVFCVSIGGVLATITTTNQMKVLTAKANDGDSVWIGANDKSVEGTWRWEDTGAVATELSGLWDVAYGQPDNYNNDDCADIYVLCADVELWDDPCTSKYSFICMEKAPTTTKTTTTITTTKKSTTTVPTTTTTLKTTKTTLPTTETALLTAATTLPTTSTTLPTTATTLPNTTTTIPTTITTLPTATITLTTTLTKLPTTSTTLPTTSKTLPTTSTTLPTTSTTLPTTSTTLPTTETAIPTSITALPTTEKTQPATLTTSNTTTTTLPTTTPTTQPTTPTTLPTTPTTEPTTTATLTTKSTFLPTAQGTIPTAATNLPSTETNLSTKPTTTPTTLTPLPTTITTTVPTTTTTLPFITSAAHNTTTTSPTSTSTSPSTTNDQPTTKPTETSTSSPSIGTIFTSLTATSTPTGITLPSTNVLIDRVRMETESVSSTQDLSQYSSDQEALPVTSSPTLERDELTTSSDSAQPMTLSDGSTFNLNQRVDEEARAEVDTTTSTPSSTTSKRGDTSESILFNQTLAIVSCVVGFLIASVLMIIIVAVCKACKACSMNKVHAL